MEEALAPALHLVAQPHHVLEGDLRLRGEALALPHGERARGLEAHLLPLQGARRHGGGDRPEVEGEVHRRARRQQRLQEAWRQGARPLAQVQRAREVAPHRDLVAVELDLDGGLFVELPGRAAEGGGEHEHPQLAAGEGMDGEAGAHEQGAQLVHALVLADGVEAAVEDALAPLQLAQQPPQRLGRRLRPRGQVLRLCGLEVVAQLAEAGRVLAHEQLQGEVAGVEGAGEGPQAGLVQLQPQHLADAELHAVEAHGPVVLKVGEHEGEGQARRRLRFRGVGLGGSRRGVRPARGWFGGGGPAREDRRRALRQFE